MVGTTGGVDEIAGADEDDGVDEDDGADEDDGVDWVDDVDETDGVGGKEETADLDDALSVPPAPVQPHSRAIAAHKRAQSNLFIFLSSFHIGYIYYTLY